MPLRKFLESKEHLDWLKVDLNAAKIITIQDYKHAQKLMTVEVHIHSVKAERQAGNLWVKYVMTT